MNFNKDYPIAILDTNIVMDVPNILGILKGCNIVIPYTLIEELDNHKKENKGTRDFVNNFLALSEKANLSKDGYKLENDCMLYLDMDKNNLSHKEIDLSSKKQDIKFIAEAKNLKEKYNDMTVVLLTSDKIIKITASTFDVKAKNLEEFLEEYLKVDINGLYELAEKYNYYGGYQKIFISLLENKDINGLYKLAENENIEENDKKVIYKEISEFLINDKDINGLYELAQYYYDAYNEIFTILLDNKDTEGLYKLAENENIEEDDKKLIYKEISEFLINDKDINGLYELAQYYYDAYNEIFEILSYNKDTEGLYKLVENENIEEDDKKLIYKKAFEILSDNKDTEGLYELAENENIEEDDKKLIYKKVFEILSDNKDTEGLYELAENENIEEDDKKLIYKKVFEILSNNKDIDGLYKLSENNYYNNVCNNEIKKIKELEYIGYELDNLFLDKKLIYREILEIILSNKYDDIKELRRLADVIRKKTYISETNNINKLKRILQRELQN